MPNYRRAFVPGGCWFFTVNLLDRRRYLLTENIDALREATRISQARHPFTIDAMVVLPDHVHAIWTLPPDDAEFSLRWQLIKISFAQAIPKTEARSEVRMRRGERGIWQRRFWEHLIRDEEDFRRHVEYCYIDPVKHGLVSRVQTGRIRHFTAMCERNCFPRIGPAISLATTVSASVGERHRRNALRLLRPTIFVLERPQTDIWPRSQVLLASNRSKGQPRAQNRPEAGAEFSCLAPRFCTPYGTLALAARGQGHIKSYGPPRRCSSAAFLVNCGRTGARCRRA